MNDTINQVGAGAPAAWTRTKPTAPGAYWIRGEGEGMLARTALVEVVNFEGELWCNLHMRNTDPEFGYGYTVAQLDEAFEWLGPLSPAAPAVQGEPVEFDYPEFHEQGMGCGLEDRGITDRYEAIRYGWDEALDRVAEIIDGIGPLYAAPPAQPDVPRCQCCGYLVTESEHRGCLRSASPHPDASVLVEALELARRTLAMAGLEGEVTRRIDTALAGKGATK